MEKEEIKDEKIEVKDESSEEQQLEEVEAEDNPYVCPKLYHEPKWWIYNPKPSKLQRTVSPYVIQDLRDEEVAARSLGVKWQYRGPIGPRYEGDKWRGQAFRATGNGGKGRWGNSGGENRDWYRGYYIAKGKGKAAVEDYLYWNPKPQKKPKEGKGKGSSKSSSSASMHY